ncbi:MAG TPA: sensor domain-containing diguanylate cyclase [bacterium]|nr:sensor domain-containing diguanylate cyclase [bacterium]
MSISNGSERALAVLAKIATEFSALTVSLPEFLNRVLKVLGQEIGFDQCLVALVDERGAGRLVVRAASGLASPRVGKPLPRGVDEDVIATGRAALIPDLAAAGHADPDFRSCICAPILVHGRAIGVLNAYRPAPRDFTGQDLNLLVVVTHYFSSAIELAHLHEQPLAGPQADPLTDLPTERTFREAVEQEQRRAHRHREPLVVLWLDIDNFAAIREEYGAARADTLLRNLAKVLRGMLRESDLVARAPSGFLLLLPRTPRRAGASVAERIRQRARGVVAEGGPSITVSLGVSEAPQDGTAADALLAAAGEALEQARRHGGDRVQTAPAAT